MAIVPQIHIREFRPGDERLFRELNEEWITRYFAMEPADEEKFADPQGKIIDSGGCILRRLMESAGLGVARSWQWVRASSRSPRWL